MTQGRWVEVSPSQFPHEVEGLRIVRDLLPQRDRFRAWSNFEFRDERGTWSEVDLLILAPDGLHLVELKYWAGRLRGDDTRWLRDGRPAQDSPLLLANRKAKRLRSKLITAYDAWKRGRTFDEPPPPARDVIPFIREAVFLHHPGFVCELPDVSRTDLYGLPGDEGRSGLTPITELFTGFPRPDVTIRESAIVGVMQLIGLRARPREAGSYVLDQQPLQDGPGWQDWLATHKHIKSQRRRIRFRVMPDGASEEAGRRDRLLAAHEMHVMQRLTHEAIVRPEDYVDSEQGPGLVYPYEPGWQRLDLWLADKPAGFDFDAQLDLIRQIAEALQYAHGKNVVHRGLNPRAVNVTSDRDGRRRIAIGDWQGVGRTDEVTSASPTRGVTSWMESDRNPVAPQERWVDEGFAAPEGVLVGAPGRLRLDVFGLGALAFYIVTGGQPPARTRADLAARLRAQGGLDVSVELPAAAPALRDAILAATRPEVSKRLPDIAAVLAALDKAVTPPVEEVTDALEAGPGAVLDGRFQLLHKLGVGSTAVGLLVKDGPAEDAPERVLKVALDDSAARRLEDEAEALRRLDSPRIVKLVEGPLTVTGRRALLLASAGRETLATLLGNRERLPLDLLERWGIDLLEAVVTLDEAGISHRDIKPANLGVREERAKNSNRSKHLVLFDFSLTRAPASDTQAGTRPYLDPFFSLGERPQYDSAGERYAAAVVLHEMATGRTPRYGDGLSDPASISAEATIDRREFDPALSSQLTAFFTRALARNHTTRHDTAAQMLLAWRACFPEATVTSDEAEALAEAATADTPLTRSGLSARALSALEQLRAATVGELIQVQALSLNALPNTSKPIRDEVSRFAILWRKKFGRRGAWRPIADSGEWKHPLDAADILLDAARTGRADNAITLVSLLLGVTGKVAANATQPELAASLRPPVTRGRVSQLLATLQDRWAAEPKASALLDQVIGATDSRLTELGGVATFNELVDHVQSLMVPRRGVTGGEDVRTVEGLLRCALDRKAAMERAGEDLAPWFLRRREGRPILVATHATLLDVAEALGRRADTLVSDTNVEGNDELVSAARVTDTLTAELPETLDTEEGQTSVAEGLREGRRLARLAATLSQQAGASATGELHHRHLSAAAALRHALPAVVAGQEFTADALRERVRARFPDLAELPKRPDLAQVVTDAALGLAWDEKRRSYLAPRSANETTGLETRAPTITVRPPSIGGPGAVGQRLLDSRERRSFVALGVPAGTVAESLRVVLRDRFDAMELDLTHTLLEALHDTAAAVGIPWSQVLTADAESSGSRAHQGLRALVQRSLPTVIEAIRQALADAGARPLVLTDASLLARYDALGILAEWLDLATPRLSAVWLVVPQVHANIGPLVDGRPLPLTAPSQYVPVPTDWINSHRLEGSTQ